MTGSALPVPRVTAGALALLMRQDIETIKNDVAAIKVKVDDQFDKMIDLKLVRLRVSEIEENCKTYVTQEEFTLVKWIVYGACGLIITTVFGALIALVIRNTTMI